jgi:penicillin-binding protein 1A
MTRQNVSTRRWLSRWLLRLGITGLAVGLVAALLVWALVMPTLPAVETLRDVRLQVPLRVVSEDGLLMAEVGEQRRTPMALDDIPDQLKRAFLAAEDDRFYRHPGIDWRGTVRGVWLYALSRGQGRVPGGSTITQQVARRFFLSTEYSVTRKLREMLLALKIERELTKDDIFELYLNKEFLGHRAYGVAAAAQVYYGKRLEDLTLAEMAQIAALPKAPSRDNPISGPRQAMIRRDWVLDRMLHLGYIDAEAHAEARAEPNRARYHGPEVALSAPWVAELVRQDVVSALGAEEAYTGGYVAFTTIDGAMQRAATRVVRDGLQDYDRRHGWRGAEQRIATTLLEDEQALAEFMGQLRAIGDLHPAVVVASDDHHAELRLRNGQFVELDLDAVRWARPHLALDALGPRPQAVNEVLNVGDVVRLRALDRDTDDSSRWRLAQVPRAEAALVALDTETGGVLAMVGGLDFSHNQFNRVTQSRRQPGSAFKPFVYAAALDQGYTLASVVNDAPVVVDDPSMERAWRPTNFSRRFHGPTPLREAMVHSRNLVSVRLLMDVGLDYARGYISDFGFSRADLPNGPSLALGSASLTPLSMTAAYATFANGGYAVEPQFLHAVQNRQGEFVMAPNWSVICRQCEPIGNAASRPSNGEDGVMGPVQPRLAPQVLSEQTAWLMDSMLSDVIRSGTGRRALSIGRQDLAGKTGTTNDLRDTWFIGYGGGVVASVWVGMDDNESLGRLEQGGRTALPLWVDFMGEALQGRPERSPPLPVGLVRAPVNPATGLRVRPGFVGAIEEWFHADHLPALETSDRNGQQDPFDIF